LPIVSDHLPLYLDYSLKQLEKRVLYLCPTWERGVAWDLWEMGSAWRGLREGPAPQKARKISSQRSVREEAAWRRKKAGQVGHDKEGPV
jgi:hypothetical protein